MSGKEICCLCGKEIEGYGNNPYPLMSVSKNCCGDCNTRYVIATREIYFPSGNSDKYVLFNQTPTFEVLTELLHSVDMIKRGSIWLSDALTAAQQERKKLEEISKVSKEIVGITEE